MADARTHLILFAIDDLREPIAQTLAPFPFISYSFATTLPELLDVINQHHSAIVLCRAEDYVNMPVGLAIIILCVDDDLLFAHFANQPAIVDVLFENRLQRLPFIVQREIRQQQALDRETRRLRMIIEHAPHGVIEVETSNRLIRWTNPAMNQLFGYSAAEMRSLRLEEMHPDEERATAIDTFHRMVAGDESPILNVICQRRDGSIFYCNIAPGGVYGNGQRLIFIFFTDVTDEYQSLQTLRVNAYRLELALRAANQGLYDIDVRSGLTIVSDEYATMLGYDPATFTETNQRWRERLHPADAAMVYQTYLDYLAGRIPEYRVEFRSRMQQGGWKWILSVGAIVERDAQGHPLRMLGTHTDISALKRLEFQERLRV